MSGDGSVIADTLKMVRDVCRVGCDEEKEIDAGTAEETNVVKNQRGRS
jgi:hypothetical protein